jgi:hypothetical protein
VIIIAILTFNDYIRLINSGVLRPVCKVQLLHDSDETVMSSVTRYPLPGSVLSISNNNSCRRSIQISFDNSDSAFKYNSNNGDFYINTKFQFYLGLEDEYKNNIFFNQGTFCLSKSEPEQISNYSERTINIKADDKFNLLDNNIDGGIYQIERGESITKKIKEIVEICNDPQEPIFDSDIENLDTAEYTLRWDGSATYAQIIRQLANMHSRDVFYDVNGQLRYQKFINEITEPSQWDYTLDTFQYCGSNRIYMNDKLYNQVYVTSSNSDSGVYTALAQNNDLTSPNRIGAIPKHTLYISDDKIYSNEMAKTRAETELARVKNLQETISLKSVVLPHLTCDKAITLTDPALNLYYARFFIQSISMPLDMKSVMTVTAYKFTGDSAYQSFEDVPNPIS